jgi:hypothetical protein
MPMYDGEWKGSVEDAVLYIKSHFVWWQDLLMFHCFYSFLWYNKHIPTKHAK